ncbi:alkaline phosphatase PafA [Pedobacter sp.]|uniref:alkaline phosphatase PafA n=1 Tax=Pedobacter sp. TaxID=1411316 RepID=UPI003D7FD510
MNYKVITTCIVLFVSSLTTNAQQSKTADTPRPKLVVGIVVDQMRWDYLYRFYQRYGDKGFKRLLNEGYSCDNTYITHVPTYTAVGHSSIYTGSVPAIHGIAGNDWINQATGKNVYCTEDESVTSVGTTNNSGKMSPKNMLVSTVTDELKLATNFKSKVIGIALKDRSSILPAGHFANAAYWYDGETANWISSTYYQKDLPKWVQDFNNQKQPQAFLSKDWNTLYPIETYMQSIADNNIYEGKFKGSAAPVFPVKTSQLIKDNGYGLLRSTPFGNTVTLNFAKDAIIKENLGHNESGATDFLAVSLSSPDYIGHQFAVNAVEIEDNYLRLDKDLEELFKFLDKNIGSADYTVFLTADHGAAHNPQFMIDKKANAGYFDSKGTLKNLNDVLTSTFGQNNIVLSLTNYQVQFNNVLIKAQKLNKAALKEKAIEFLRDVDGVAFVTDMDKAAEAAIPLRIRERIVNGYNYKRSGSIQIILEPQLYSGTAKSTGTTHGSWNPYDSHIPLVFMGWGIKTGKTNKVFSMTDIAPTVAALLNIQEPNGNIGSPITEVLKSQK